MSRTALIEHVRKLAAEQPANYGGFLARLRELPAAALEGALALHERDPELYWVLGDFLQGGVAAEGSCSDSGGDRCSEIAQVIDAAKAVIKRLEEDDEPPEVA